VLEFMNEKKHRAKKEYVCNICGWTIHAGEMYYRCAAKQDGELLDYCQHIHCRNMSVEYCNEQGESEYDRDTIDDYLHERYCSECEHGYSHETDEDYEECDFSVFECPKLIKRFSDKEETNDGCKG